MTHTHTKKKKKTLRNYAEYHNNNQALPIITPKDRKYCTNPIMVITMRTHKIVTPTKSKSKHSDINTSKIKDFDKNDMSIHFSNY